MQILDKMRNFVYRAAILLGAAALALAAPLFSRGTSDENKSRVLSRGPQSECTFSDGSTITFGRKATGASNVSGGDVWRARPYEAAAFRVSERMVIPPLDSPTEIPTGSYTLFVVDQGKPPWTLIISKKTGEWGMPYPGEQYDLGRTELGSDVVRPPAENFEIGCVDNKKTGGPIFVWMQSGTQVAYAKIMAENTSQGETRLLFH
ncbi:MAG: DUF2911 domain-containing protein [Candidatus Sulfotelmatobacter sp.]